MTKPKPKPKLALARPSARIAPSVDDGEQRLVLNVPTSLHKAIKREALERGITVRALVLELIARAGIRGA